MGIFLNAVYSKIDVFVKFESAINLEIKVQIKKKYFDSFYLGHKDHIYVVCMFVAGISVEMFTTASTLYFLIQFVKKKQEITHSKIFCMF